MKSWIRTGLVAVWWKKLLVEFNTPIGRLSCSPCKLALGGLLGRSTKLAAIYYYFNFSRCVVVPNFTNDGCVTIKHIKCRSF